MGPALHPAPELIRMAGLELRQFKGADLEPIDLAIAPGECVTLTGPSGSGKTRLLRAIADLDTNRGEASSGELNLQQAPAHLWRRRVGLLPAESHWWYDRVGDHFTRPEKEKIAALGLDPACLEWEVGRLSSGERQRLALARLLDRKPGVLLLDEPTANLDPENCQRVEQLLQRYASEQNAALLWVSHDPAQRQRVGQRRLKIRERRLETETGG
ncbi:MAG: ATP-binding cassette domain-containing protein [Sedimenticola sp.]|nr:ATP-binding cassette domain-containing protein [Sedimenticola sp.]